MIYENQVQLLFNHEIKIWSKVLFLTFQILETINFTVLVLKS
ncbi:hypothetical protein NT06LI_1970 [Listeria innocua FSL J1-023]|nr:hypothetical protein NT06LI_1970 [Listeria innocua FSL J1-023]